MVVKMSDEILYDYLRGTAFIAVCLVVVILLVLISMLPYHLGLLISTPAFYFLGKFLRKRVKIDLDGRGRKW